jgi:hypothetical protein
MRDNARNVGVGAVILTLVVIVVCNSVGPATAQTYTFCPNSGIDCTITRDDGNTTTTVDSEKGENDAALVIVYE